MPLASQERFPRASEVAELHRLSEYPGAWWYSHVHDPDEDTGGRFDLTGPHGDRNETERLLAARNVVVRPIPHRVPIARPDPPG